MHRTHYFTPNPHQLLHATKNTKLQLVMWYKARVPWNSIRNESLLLVSLFAKSFPPLTCPSKQSVVWYRVVVSLINYETFEDWWEALRHAVCGQW